MLLNEERSPRALEREDPAAFRASVELNRLLFPNRLCAAADPCSATSRQYGGFLPVPATFSPPAKCTFTYVRNAKVRRAAAAVRLGGFSKEHAEDRVDAGRCWKHLSQKDQTAEIRPGVRSAVLRVLLSGLASVGRVEGKLVKRRVFRRLLIWRVK